MTPPVNSFLLIGAPVMDSRFCCECSNKNAFPILINFHSRIPYSTTTQSLESEISPQSTTSNPINQSTTATSSYRGGSSSTWVILWIVFGVILRTLVIIATSCKVYRKRQSISQSENIGSEENHGKNAQLDEMQGANTGSVEKHTGL